MNHVCDVFSYWFCVEMQPALSAVNVRMTIWTYLLLMIMSLDVLNEILQKPAVVSD